MIDLNGKKILVVDDEPDIRDIVKDEFDIQGGKVFEASNGKEAFKVANSNSVDVIVSDVRMAGGSGVDLLKEIRAQSSHSPVVILITGFTDSTAEEVYQFGADALFPKPCDLEQLSKAASRALLPKEMRWQESGAQPNLQQVNMNFDSFDSATANGLLKIGRGGMYLERASDESYHEGQSISFNIQFQSGKVQSFSGTGIVRWVAHSADGKSNLGLGIEFDGLTDVTRNLVMNYINQANPTPFIPGRGSVAS